MPRWKAPSILSKKQVQSFFTGNMGPIRQKLLPRCDAERAYLHRESFTCPWRLVREYDLDDDMATDDPPRPSHVDTAPLATDDPPRLSQLDSKPGPSARGEQRLPPVEARAHDASLRHEIASLRDEFRSDIASLRAEQAAIGANVSAMLGILSTLVEPRTPHSAPPPPTASYSARPPPFTYGPPPPPAFSVPPPRMPFSSPSPSVQSALPAPSSAQEQEGDDDVVDDYFVDIVSQQQQGTTIDTGSQRLRKASAAVLSPYVVPQQAKRRRVSWGI